MNHIGEKIKYERLKHSLTQAELSDISNVNKSYVSRIERGELWDIPRIKMICEVLEIPYNNHITEENNVYELKQEDEHQCTFSVQLSNFTYHMDVKIEASDQITEALLPVLYMSAKESLKQIMVKYQKEINDGMANTLQHEMQRIQNELMAIKQTMYKLTGS